MFDVLLVFRAGFVLYGVYFAIYLIELKLGWRRRSLPPGPPVLPIIGNLLDLPRGVESLHWAKHKDLYGPISSVTVFGTTYIIVNDMKIVFDLLEKRSSIYSSRPVCTFGGEMVGFSPFTVLLPYGKRLKEHRKNMRSYIGTYNAKNKLELIVEIEMRRFLVGLLNAPEDMRNHIRGAAGAIILKVAYGYSIERDKGDPLVDLVERGMEFFSDSCLPGKWAVDALPILRHFPEWLPGMGFKKKARERRPGVHELLDTPFKFVKHQIASGKENQSFVSEYIEQVRNEDDEESLKWAAGTLFAGGTDTTVNTVTTFFLAMLVNPSALKRAQEEIDRVIGPDRLPTPADRPMLPYIDALAKETLRWQVVAPLGFPHYSTEEDTYMGYHIPKGSVILPNIGQIAHDPVHYHDPYTFKPERFLGENGMPVELDPRTLVFGFGRRICPGRELGDGSLFTCIAMTVAAFDICRTKDEFGREIEPTFEYLPGNISHPTPFKFIAKPRSERATSLIRSVEEDFPTDEGDADILMHLQSLNVR